MKILIILISLFSITFSQAKGIKRKVANYDVELVTGGKKVLNSFLACGHGKPKDEAGVKKLQDCSKQFLSSDLAKFVKNRYDAWILTPVEISSIGLCDQPDDRFFRYVESYDLQLCFALKQPKGSERGSAFFKFEAGKLKILEIQD
ncbi:MAG: hypothetical protein AB7I27_10710 [Bacteriovoracaceae bacterium]